MMGSCIGSASASVVTLERSHMAATEQYARTGDSAYARLTVVDSVLSSLVSTLTAAQVEVLAARGSTKSPQEREASAQAPGAVSLDDTHAALLPVECRERQARGLSQYTRLDGVVRQPQRGSRVDSPAPARRSTVSPAHSTP